MIIGIGTRRGITREEVVEAVKQALDECNLNLEEVTVLASAKLKKNERGLLEAGKMLGLKGVAEPAALALSEEKKLISRKKVYGRVTIAIAK